MVKFVENIPKVKQYIGASTGRRRQQETPVNNFPRTYGEKTLQSRKQIIIRNVDTGSRDALLLLETQQ